MRAPRALIGLFAAGALVLSACGDDDESESSAPASESGATDTSTPASQESTPDSSEPSTDSSDPGDGPVAFDPSLPPVIIGFHNLEGGTYSIPEAREAFEAGVEYVNTELGGIEGHELQVEYCELDVTPESTINCANQFAEKGVVAAVQGFDLAVDAALPILTEAGILEIAPSPLGAAINTAVGDAIVMGASTEGGAAIAGLIQADNMGATKVAYLMADVPSMHSLFDGVIAPSAETLGADVEVYYYSQPTDWTTFAPTALSGGADSISMFGVDADFLAAIPAFRGAGFEGVFNANTFAQFDQLDPSMLEDVIVSGSYYTETMVSGVPDEAQADIDDYVRYVPNPGRPTPARTGFYIAVMAADVLRQVDDPTSAAAVLAQGPKAKGHVFFTDQEYDCATPSWPDTTSCTGATFYSSITADGKLEVLPDQPVDVAAAFPAG